ncbi:unnamed protein product [Nesidiocoris tenuis]|uniref:Uncharacterized protein n=1 Tax=Nesidiocoris tenuis TaxID=355587 RepID=A0A6H5G1A9_9HEMI|nr:unnamed protein product [Nesidiocoris tenuis]
MKFKYVHSLRDLEIFSPIGVPGDFMALFVDTENLAALGGLRTDMLRLEHNFRVTRTVLVNGCCKSGPPGACQQVSHLADEMRVPPMNAHISSDFKYNKRIALKLIRMAASCTGAAHGTPARLPVVEDLQFVLANSTLYTTRMTTAGNIDMDVDSDE